VSKSQDIGVVHWTDGRKTRNLGWSGLFTRIRGLISVELAISLLLAGPPFWWPWAQTHFKLPEIPKTIDTKYVIWGSCLFAMLAAAGVFFYARKRVVRALAMKASFHDLAHKIRDVTSDTYQRTTGKKGAVTDRDPIHERKHLTDSSNEIATLVRDFIVELTGDKSVGCAIRLAQDRPGDAADSIEYVTVGRSNLNGNRHKTTEAIPASEGIPKFFLASEQACNGILFFDDLKTATSNGIYKRTDNDSKFQDYSTLVAAPLNGWNGKRRSLIGILCISSHSKKILNIRQIDIYRSIADMLALAFVSTLGRLQTSGSLPALTEKSESSVLP